MSKSARNRISLGLTMLILLIVTGLVMVSSCAQNYVKAQEPICVDRPEDQRATSPGTVWVEVGEDYLNDWLAVGETAPFARQFSLDFYVAGVLIGEMGPNPAAGNVTLPASDNEWEDAALEAMSVAIRSFTWFRLNYNDPQKRDHELRWNIITTTSLWRKE